MSEAERRVQQWARRTPGVRILHRIGFTTVLRAVLVGLWILAIGQTVAVFRPDLLYPADLGSDTSNYVAAAERMDQRSSIYTIAAGDRPVPLDNPPEWNKLPLLSPPTAATLFAWAPALPAGLGFYPVWAIGLAGTMAAGLLAIALAPTLFLVAVYLLLPGLAVTAWSGNVNALLAPLIPISWWSLRSTSRWAQGFAGAFVGIAIAVKLGPAFLGWWILWQRRAAASLAMIVALALVLVATLILAGTSSFTDYVGIIRATASEPSRLSIPGILTTLGLPSEVATMLLPVILLGVAAIVARLASRPVGFLYAVIGMIFATTVVRYDSIALVVLAGVAWEGRSLIAGTHSDLASDPGGLGLPSRPSVQRLATVASVFVATIALGLSLASGGLVRSTVLLENQSAEPVIVRLSMTGQSATFGFELPPNSKVSAWEGRTGASPPFALIFGPDCRLVQRVSLPRAGATLVATANAVRIEAPGPVAEPSGFSDACAAEARALTIQFGSTQAGARPHDQQAGSGQYHRLVTEGPGALRGWRPMQRALGAS